MSSATTITINLPDATSSTWFNSSPSPATSRLLVIKRRDNNSSGTVTLSPASGQTIDGASSYSMATRKGVELISDGLNWYILSGS